MTDSKKDYKSYHSLIMFQKADELALLIYKLTKDFPKEELFGLTSQLRRASTSVPANIAEGYARFGIQDKRRFLNISQGSLIETRYFCEFAAKIGLINNNQLDAIMVLSNQVGKLLCGYSKSLINKTETSHPFGRLRLSDQSLVTSH